MKDYLYREPCDDFPVAMAYVPGSILRESAKIWKRVTATAPSSLSSTNRLQEGDVVTDECTVFQ